jgi:predicted glycoside hydrolase/deacetylase ChbG (UPF0249 family)
MSAEKLLIVNADEFGRAAGVNLGIVDAHRKGIVSSASLMVAGRAAPEAVTLARANPGLGLGLHVTLTKLSSVLPAVEIPSLARPDGRLPADAGGRASARQAEILEGVRAQYRRVRQHLGRLPTHLDTHGHVHTQRAVFAALVTLAWETGLPLRAVSAAMRFKLRQEGLGSAEQFEGGFRGEDATTSTLLALLQRVGPGTTELMCRPGHVDADLTAESDYTAPRARELAALTDPAIRAALQTLGIRLVHYGEVFGS